MSDVGDVAALMQLEHVYKRFGSRVVLRDVSFDLFPQEVVAVLGANGAGKTTLLRILATLSRPSRGSVSAFGADAWRERRAVRSRIGVVAHQPFIYAELTCSENLRFFAEMYQVHDVPLRVATTLDHVGLSSRGNDRAGSLSRGLLQRLNLARAILHAPAILILDEPDTGLDVAGRDVLSRIVRSQAERGGSVVLTSHSLDYALSLATRVNTIAGSRVAMNAPRGEIAEADIIPTLMQASETGV